MDTEQGSDLELYALECYGCGRVGTLELFGMGWNRRCPDCGSGEVHAVRVEPGDVILIQPGDYYAVKDEPRRAVVDGSHFALNFDDGRGPVVLAVLAASAFRGDGGGRSNRVTEPADEKVSVSGGPCPFVPIAELRYAGQTDQTFWRWADRPRAGGGENYTRSVHLWRWEPGR